LPNYSGYTHDTFAAQCGGFFNWLFIQMMMRRIKNGLRAAFAVTDVNEDEAAEIAAGVNPAGQRDGLPDVCRAQLVAMMRAFH
jgi:hypothetical protein